MRQTLGLQLCCGIHGAETCGLLGACGRAFAEAGLPAPQSWYKAFVARDSKADCKASRKKSCVKYMVSLLCDWTKQRQPVFRPVSLPGLEIGQDSGDPSAAQAFLLFGELLDL